MSASDRRNSPPWPLDDDEGTSLSDSQRQRALAAAQVGTWSRSLVDGAARVDPLWCHSLGLDPCEGPEHLDRWARRIHPDDVGRFRRAGEQLATAAEDAPDFDVEYRILTADSRWLWVLQRGRVCRRDPRGDAPLEAAGICIDIDARKRAEVEVQENESRLATALWGAQAAFWQLHIPSDTAIRSPLWFAMTGYTEQSWNSLPSPWIARLHPDDRPQVERQIAEHLAGRSQSLELRYRTQCADGAWKWMMDRGRVVEWDFDGRPIAAIGVSMDIDRQKRAELALYSSETRLETAIWGAGVGLYELDCASGVTHWLNDWCERFDIDPCAGAEHVDRWDSNIHPEDLPAARARFSGHLAGSEEYYDAEYRIRTRRGAWRWIFERGRVTDRDAAGAPVRLVGTCMDIDARRRVELAAEDSRRRLELALESAQGCLWEWDIARAEYNDGYYELHGVAPQEGRRSRTFWSDRAHPHDRERVMAAERELIDGRIEAFNAQYRVRHADGSWRWMVDRFRAAERDEHGRATRLIGFAMDVTEDVQVREALQVSESALRAVAANTPDWLMLLDRESRCRFINRPIQGRDVEAMLGQDLSALAPIEHVEAMREAVAVVLRTGEPRMLLQRLTSPDPKQVRHLETWVTAARDGDEIVGTVLTMTDVTERLRHQQALQAQAQILETMSEAVLLLDERDVAKMANPAFEALACRTRAEIIGQSLTDLLHGCVTDFAEISSAALAYWKVHPWMTPMRRELDWSSPDGRTHRLLAAFTRIEIDGASHILSVYTDITEQRQVERQMLDVVQRAQRRIGADLHDGLGQELTGIAMLLRGLQTDVAGDRPATPAQIEELIGLVNNSIEAARSMARGLAPVDPEDGGLAGALQRLAASASRQSSVHVELRNQLPPSVTFSREESTHLFRIAQEAVSNALRHAAPSAVQIALSFEAGFACLRVSDDGRGFPDAGGPQRGIGLETMRFRASALRGDVQLLRNASLQGRAPGMTLLCRVPVHSQCRVGTTSVPQDSSRP